MYKEEMRSLINQLQKWDDLYNKGIPAVTDNEYDKFYFELQSLENTSGFIFTDSPTHNIRYKVVNELKKVQHNHPMLSLAKTKSIEDLNDFVDDKHYCVMGKLDGLTISVRYIDGKLISAETRGDGHIGEDVTHNAFTVSNLPKVIDYKDELIVDGEAIITYDSFEEFKEKYANPRNLVSGSIRLLDANEAAKRHINFVAWKVIKGFDDESWFSSKLDRLDRLGFDTVPRYCDDDFCNIIEPHNMEDLISLTKKDCEDQFYPIDGIVIGIDSIIDAAAMGEATQHHVQYQIAFKFMEDEYETNLQDIVFDVSRNGQMVPVAVFDKVETFDSVLSRASLHNITIMKKILGRPYKNQPIRVAKMNEIIPQVVWADIDKEGSSEIRLPDHCPICGASTEIRQDGVAEILYCSNKHCPARLSEQINHFCSKKGLDIRGLSEKTIDFLIEKEWLTCIKDLYNLEFYSGRWKHERGWGEASVEKILSAIKSSRTFPLDKFICALGIREIGASASKELAKRYGNWESFRKATREELLNIAGFGSIMVDEILSFDYMEADEIMKEFYKGQPNPNPIKNIGTTVPSSSLQNKTFVITGKLSKSRSEVAADIEKAGGKVTSAVSSKTNFLVTDNPASATGKAEKAKELGTKIISEEELYEMIGQD